MNITTVTEDGIIVNEVHLTTSVIEYLVISSALAQFINNHDNSLSDIEVAKKMREVINKKG